MDMALAAARLCVSVFLNVGSPDRCPNLNSLQRLQSDLALHISFGPLRIRGAVRG